MPRKLMTGVCLSLAGALCLSALVIAAPSTSPVADAVMNGDLAGTRTLLEKGADPNAAQNDGMTALHWAALNGDLAAARMLLVAGANPNAMVRIGAYTPLDIAAKDGHADLVAALLSGGANPTLADDHGTTPLMMAAASGDVATINELLKAGADVNAKENVRDETALMFAAAYGRTAAVKTLLAHGAAWKSATKVLDWGNLPPKDSRLPSRSGFGPPPAQGKAKGASRPAKAATRPAASEKPTATKVADAKEGKTVPATGGAPAKKPNPADFFLGYYKQVGKVGGLTALLFAARQGDADTAQALIDGGADVNQVSSGDHTSPLMMAIVNGRFDLADQLLKEGANPNLAQENGAAPLYAVLNCVWADRTLYPQPTAYDQQKITYLQLMQDLLAHGANPNARLKKHVWYSAYNFDQEGLDQSGATAFWRAAYADDVEAMKLLVAHGADPNIPTIKPKSNRRAAFFNRKPAKDYSGLPPVPEGGPDISPLLAAAGEGYGSSLTSNHHRIAPTGFLAAIKYLVGTLHADVNARDADGNTALDNAAARGDNASILYLVSHGADIKTVNRKGQTVADMANGPVQRVSPYLETIRLAEQLGAKLMHGCFSCGAQ